MKETIFEIEQEETAKNITFKFQVNPHYDAIKVAIMKRHKLSARSTTVLTPSKPPPPFQKVHNHVGGLPSPPVEDRKVVEEVVAVEETIVDDSPSSSDIKQTIQDLVDEKHKLFQHLKQLMLDDQLKKKHDQLMLQKQKQAEREKQQEKLVVTKRKSRWAPSPQQPLSQYNTNQPPPYYHHSRPPPAPRYNPYANVSYFK